MSTPVAVFGADEQTAIPVDVARWVRLAQVVLDVERSPPAAEVALLFVERDAIAELNTRFLGHEGHTDVLAFPIDEETRSGGRRPDEGGRGPGTPTDRADEPPTLLGDVVVCPEVARDQARDHGVSLEEELALLVVHGVLHLLGYDHADPSDSAVMQARERALLDRFRSIEAGERGR